MSESAYFEPKRPDWSDVRSIVIACIENGARSLLLDEEALPAEFFDLSSGVAGELLHHLFKYRMPVAAVIRSPSKHSQNFQAFVRESNKGQQARFFGARAEAVAWLEQVTSR